MRNKNKLSYCSTYNVSSLAYWVDGEDRGRVWGEEETLWGTRGTVEQFKRWLYKNWTQLYSRDYWTTTTVQTTEGINDISILSLSYSLCKVEVEEKQVQLKEAKERLEQLNNRIEVMLSWITSVLSWQL